jgi:putative transposase
MNQIKMKGPTPHDSCACKRYKLDREAPVAPGKNRKCSEARAVIALLVRHEDRLSLTDLGKRLGRDLSSLSKAVNGLRRPMETNPSAAPAFDKIRQVRAEIHISQA